MKIPFACAAILLSVAIGGCASTPAPSASENPPSANAPSPSTPGPAASSAGSVEPAGPSASAASGSARLAAQHLLTTKAFDLELKILREKRSTDPVQTLVEGSGRMEPATGRGHVRYDFTGLLTPPGTSPSPSAPNVVELVWTPDDEYVRLARDAAGKYETQTREHARETGGIVGRLPDEVLGLATLVAQSQPSQAHPLEPAELAGFAAERWTITVPVEAAAAAGVPGYLPDAAAIRSQYGKSEIDIEVWLIGGVLRRLQYQLAREQAPYGGPDRTTTTYDWLNAADDIEIEVPA
jgi:hypothetical protein